MFRYISADRRVPKHHPRRTTPAMADMALMDLAQRFDGMYLSAGAAADSAGATIAGVCCWRSCTRCAANGCRWSNPAISSCAPGSAD